MTERRVLHIEISAPDESLRQFADAMASSRAG